LILVLGLLYCRIINGLILAASGSFYPFSHKLLKYGTFKNSPTSANRTKTAAPV